MNREQIAGQIRIILPVLLALLGFNTMGAETVSAIADALVNIGFSAFALGMMWWSWHSNKTSTQIDNVSKMKEVLAPIVTTPEMANVVLKDNPQVIDAVTALKAIHVEPLKAQAEVTRAQEKADKK